MSITRRVLESAQSGFSKLTSLVIVDDEPLSNVDAVALQAELAARKAARAKLGTTAVNPLGKLATSDPAARTARERAARERGARIHKERDDRAARQKSQADDAFRRMKEQAARGNWSTPSSSSGSSSGSTRSSKADAALLDWYKVLDVAPGADLGTIKSAYRQMMRKYHPDMHAGSPSKQKAATELSVRVTTAYNGLVSHLEKK